MAEQEVEIIELALEPIPPDTVETIKAELVPYIWEALREAGREQLFTDGDIQIEIEKTIPIDWPELSKIAVTALFTVTGGIALKTYEAIVLPKLKKRFKVKSRKRSRRRKKR